MKKTLLTILLVAAFSKAGTHSYTTEELANLHTFKMILELNVEGTSELYQKIIENEKEYSTLGFFQLGRKSQLTQANCADIKSTVASQLLMLATSIEQAKKTIEKLDFNGSDEVVQNLLMQYISGARSGMDNCADIYQSKQSIESALYGISEAKKYFDLAIPELIPNK